MKNAIFFLILVILSSLQVFTQISKPTLYLPQKFDVIKYDAELRISNPSKDSIIGKNQVILVWKQKSIVNEFFFHLLQLKVDSIIYNNTKISFKKNDTLSKTNWYYSVPFNENISDTTVFTIFYSGKMGAENFNGWQGGVNYQINTLYSLGVGFVDSSVATTRYWFPCYDHPSEKALTKIKFIIPDSLQAISNGLLTKETKSGGVAEYTWETQFPITSYLMTFAIGTFIKIDFAVEGIEELVYCQVKDTAKTKYVFQKLPIMVNLFDSLYTKYPFEKVGYVNTYYGNMEHQSLVCFSIDEVNSSFSRKITDDSIIAHELSHQWFGDFVTPLDFRDAWFNESFATYNEIVWNSYLFGKNRYFKEVLIKRAKYFNNAKSEGILSIYDYQRKSPSSNYPSVIYEKGACVIGMLRYYLGDSTYYANLRSIFKDHAYSNITTDQVLTYFKNGKNDLDDFFQTWWYDKGFPKIDVNVIYSKSEGTYLNISQSITNSTAQYYRLPVELRLKVRNCADSSIAIDTTIVIDMQSADYKYKLGLNCGKIDSLKFTYTKVVGLFQEGKINLNTDVAKETEIEENSIETIPNPVNGKLNILIKDIEKFNFQSIDQILVYNELGIEILNLDNKPDFTINSGNYELNLSTIPNGSFVIVLKSQGNFFTKRIIKYE